MKITLICHSDNSGGAAIVTTRLAQALHDEGIDTCLLVMHSSGNPIDGEKVYGENLKGKFYFLAERAEIFARNGFNRSNLFKVDTARFGFDLSNHPDVEDADAVIISWVNQGALSLKSVAKIASKPHRPVLWMMHDMWEITGVCHHALQCTRFESGCGCCQFLGSRSVHDLSAEVYHEKSRIYADSPNLSFVAVSRWLAEKAAHSGLMKGKQINVIPNPFPTEEFSCQRRNDFGFKPTCTVIVMGAARLDDPIKDFPMAIETVRQLKMRHPEVAARSQILLFGDLRDSSLLDRFEIPCKWLGRIADKNEIPRIYANADIVLSTSLFETLPGTLIEGMASGCIAVATNNGGQRDIVENGVTGFLACSGNDTASSLADGIAKATALNVTRQTLADDIARRFSASAVASSYIKLIISLRQNL